MFSARLLSRCLCEDVKMVKMVLTVSVSTHARPNLATCYGWLIIFDGGLLSEWSRATLGCLSASVTVCLLSPPHFILLLVSCPFLFQEPHHSLGLLLGEKHRTSRKETRFIHLCQFVLLGLIPQKHICWDYKSHGNTVLIPQIMRLVKLGCFAFLLRCFLWGHYGTLNKSLLILLLCNSTHD